MRILLAWLPCALLMVADGRPQPQETPSAVEEVYVFRSVAERTTQGVTDFCREQAPFTASLENDYSLWSIAGEESTGRVSDAKRRQIGRLRVCIAPNSDGTARLFASGTINGIAFKGIGDQSVAQQTPTIRSNVNRFLLDGLPPPYVAGIVSSNTVRPTPADSPGYVLSSVAVVRLWKRPS